MQGLIKDIARREEYGPGGRDGRGVLCLVDHASPLAGADR